jgi:hypothetical protein
VCITWLLQEVQELDVVYSSLQALLLPVHQSSVIVVDDDDDHQQPPTRRPKRKASPPIVDEDEPPLARIPKAKSSLPPTTVTANDDEQPTAQRLKREAPPPSDVWSIMTSKDMPQTRKPQFGHLKGKALYHQVKELPLWVMMQDFALWFSTKDIILQWLSVVHGINPNRNTKVDPDPMLTAMAKYGFPPPGILLRSPTVLSENAGISQFLCHSLSDRATFAYKGPSSVHSMVVSATFARSNHACTSERVVFGYRCLNS